MKAQVRKGERLDIVAVVAKGFGQLAQLVDLAWTCPRCGDRRRRRFEGKPDVVEVHQELLVDPDIEVPSEDIAIEHVPGRMIGDLRADARLGDHEAFGGQRLHRFPQDRAGHLEAGGQFRIVGKQAADRQFAADDLATQLADHLAVTVSRKTCCMAETRQMRQCTDPPRSSFVAPA